MELRQALKEQFHAGLAMLAECVEKCPEEMWTEGERPRAFWQIAWHAAYFAHNYLAPDMEAFNASAGGWPAAAREALGVSAAQKAVDVEPCELPDCAAPLSKPGLLEYVGHVRGGVDAMIDALDLDSAETGFPWYADMAKLSHVLMSLRHLQGHVGQLSERLMARGIDTDWIAAAGPVA